MKKGLVRVFTVAMALLLCSSTASFASSTKTCDIREIDSFPANSMERYAYCKAVENGTTFEYELEKEKESIVPMANDEYVAYVSNEKK